MPQAAPQPPPPNWRAGFEKARDLLGLHEWTLHDLRYDSGMDSAHATVYATPERNSFCVELHPDADRTPAEEQAELAVHELLHIMMEPLLRVTHSLLDQYSERDKLAATMAALLCIEKERLTDRLARLLAPAWKAELIAALTAPAPDPEAPDAGR